MHTYVIQTLHIIGKPLRYKSNVIVRLSIISALYRIHKIIKLSSCGKVILSIDFRSQTENRKTRNANCEGTFIRECGHFKPDQAILKLIFV